MTRIGFVKRVIRLARRAEKLCPTQRLRPVRTLVTYGFMIRQRRLAEAIHRLGSRWAYEARCLARPTTEMFINLEWMRLYRGRARALRFVRFEPLERKKIANDIAGAMSQDAAKKMMAKYDAQCRGVRHLFRFKDQSTLKMSWARHWAKAEALRARFNEVQTVQATRLKKPRGDNFRYGVYAWMSSALHGGPLSLTEVLSDSHGRPVPKSRPESRWDAHLASAGVTLLLTIKAFAEEARLRRALGPEIRDLMKELQRGLRSAA